LVQRGVGEGRVTRHRLGRARERKRGKNQCESKTLRHTEEGWAGLVMHIVRERKIIRDSSGGITWVSKKVEQVVLGVCLREYHKRGDEVGGRNSLVTGESSQTSSKGGIKHREVS